MFMELPKSVSYKYILFDDKTGMRETEKISQRSFEICKPDTYKGLISKEGQMITNKCWVVNGTIEKVDGNFINKFQIYKIGDTGLSIGGYPLNEKDFNKIDGMGIKTIVNLMTDEEMDLRDLKLDQIQVFCNRKQVKYIRLPMKDMLEDEYCFDLFSAAKELNKIVNPNS